MPSGSTGGGTTYQNSTSSNAPPAFIQPYLQKGISDLSDYYDAHRTAPQYYGGETVAPLSAQSQGAVGMASGLAGNNPTLGAANTQLTDTLNGQYLDPSQNPAYQGAVHAAVDPLTTQFLDQTMPQITSQFAGAGGTGSGIQQQYVDDATKAYGTGIGNAAYTAANNFYNNARTNQIQAAGLTPGVNGANWQDVSGLGAAGSTVDQQRQAQDTSSQAAYNYNANAQPNWISQYLSMINGGYPGGESTGSSTGTSYQPTNQFGSIFGNALSGAGLGLAAFSAFSDERLKDDFGVIGTTFDGQPLHFFQYKGEDRPQVGLMAQEVERIHPEAVSTHPSGFKVVDYSKAVGLF